MADPILTDPRYARIWVKATAPDTPAAAELLCAINRKALNQSLTTTTAVIPDCDDPTIVKMVKRTAVSKDASINGTGYFESGSRAKLQGIMDDAVSSDVVFEIMEPDPNPGWYSGKFFLETFNIVANNEDGYITVELNFTADGDVSWTDAPP